MIGLLGICLLFLANLGEPGEPDQPFAQQMLNKVNALRAQGCQCGDWVMPVTRPLQWSPRLARAAAAHAEDLQKHNQISHTGSDGSGIGDRVSRTGYSWRAVGENVAFGHYRVPGVVRAWRYSPGHCRNMLNASFYEMGAARRGPIMVQVFGRRF